MTTNSSFVLRTALLVALTVFVMTPMTGAQASRQPHALWHRNELKNGGDPPILTTKSYVVATNNSGNWFFVNKTTGATVSQPNMSNWHVPDTLLEHPSDPYKVYLFFVAVIQHFDLRHPEKPVWTLDYGGSYNYMFMGAGERTLILTGWKLGFVDIDTGKFIKQESSDYTAVDGDTGVLINQVNGSFQRIDPRTTEVMWTSKNMSNASGVCIAKGRYLLGWGPGTTDNQTVIAVNVQDGSVAWQQVLQIDGSQNLWMKCDGDDTGNHFFVGTRYYSAYIIPIETGIPLYNWEVTEWKFDSCFDSIRIKSGIVMFYRMVRYDLPNTRPGTEWIAFPHYHAFDLSTQNDRWAIDAAPYNEWSVSGGSSFFSYIGNYLFAPNIMGYSLFDLNDGSLVSSSLSMLGGLRAYAVDMLPHSNTPVAFVVGADGLTALQL